MEYVEASPEPLNRHKHCGRTNPTLTLVLLVALIGLQTAHAQTYRVIHDFTGGGDGSYPVATLTLGPGGVLYGAAPGGAYGDAGVVFKLKQTGENWILTPLYSFRGGYDGKNPYSPVTIGPDGSLYGTTLAGGYTQSSYCAQSGCGVLYRLRPPASAPASVISPWTETVLHAFVGPTTDGDQPIFGSLMFDRAGNLYGTSEFGGTGGFGTVFQLTPSGGSWMENILFNFSYGASGEQPQSSVIMDGAGNLYGTASEGGFNGNGDGVAYELSPTQYGWVETVLHTFEHTDGALVYSGLVMDTAGNLYGATYVGGTHNGGVIYELSPSAGGWTFQIIYNLVGTTGPVESLTLDAAGNLYGTTFGDGTNGAGMVFKLSPSNGSWTLTDLHDFTFDVAWFPYGGVTLDSNGNLYGTASNGGLYGHGIVWEITP